MTKYNKWVSGEHNVICDRCGEQKKRSQCRKQWNNLIVCQDTCWERKHPAETPPPIIFDGRPVRDARPETADVFIESPGIQAWENIFLEPYRGNDYWAVLDVEWEEM